MSKLLTPLEIAALKVENRQMHNEINWAFAQMRGHNRASDDIGLLPFASVDDEKLLNETEVDVANAFDWVINLEAA